MGHPCARGGRLAEVVVAVTAMVTVVGLLGGTALAATAPPEGEVRAAGAVDAVPGQYIVVLKDADRQTARLSASTSSLADRYGATVGTRYDGTFRGFSARLSRLGARRLAADPAVAYVEQDRRLQLSGTQRNPPSWGLDRIDQRGRTRSRSYSYSRTASNVTAYILDTGVRVNHRDFGGRARNGWDFIGRDAVANDCHGHGTHVAGTVGGSAYGVAKGVRLVGVRVLDCQGSGWISQVIAGVNWVTRHARKPAVANMSLGGGASSALDAAVRASIASGVTYAVAAGNEGRNACYGSPARVSTAITVGATGSTDGRASFSNYGACLDIFAPGVNITSAFPRTRTAAASWSGTSMAAPHVAGAAALVLAAHPRYTTWQVRNALVAGATRGRVTHRGAGSPDRLLYSPATTAPPTPAPAPPPPPPSPPSPPPGGCLSQTNETDHQFDYGVTQSTVSFTGCPGYASATSTVRVDIPTATRGHVVLTLVAPDGSAYPLKDADELDIVSGLDATYTVNLSAEARSGTWQLVVGQDFGGIAGEWLESWTLTL